MNELAELPIDELERRLKFSREGLTPQDARRRLEQFGYNELSEARVNPLLKFLTYFCRPDSVDD